MVSQVNMIVVPRHVLPPTLQESRFLRLPLELRRHIYSYILPYTIALKTPQQPASVHPTVIWLRRSTNLLRVSRRVHEECADVLYSTNTFVIDITFSVVKFHMTWLTAKGLRPKSLYDFPHIFAVQNIRRIRNYALTVEHIDSYQGWIKYNCQGPMLTAGIKDRVMQFVQVASRAGHLGSLFVQLTDGNPVLKDIRRFVTAYRVEQGKDIAAMQEVLDPLLSLHATFVKISGAVLPEYASMLTKAVLQGQTAHEGAVRSVAPNIEPAVLWRWQMNWNA